MYPDLAVDVDDLRRTASAVAATADRVTTGTRLEPAVDRIPRWSTTDAASLAGAAARAQLALLGADLADTARQIAEAAQAYQEADARAAYRLHERRLR